MKLLVATLAVAVAIASPALAKSKKKRVPSPGITTVVPGAGPYYTRSPNPSWDVYGPGGRYVGSDPDPRVRIEMSNDAFIGYSNR